MKNLIQIAILILFTLNSSCSQNKSLESAYSEKEYKWHTVKNQFDNQLIYSLKVPKEWLINEDPSINTYISDSNLLEVTRWFDQNSYSYSDNEELVKSLSGGRTIGNKVYSLDDIIKEQITPKLKSEGFDLISQFPLNKINQNAIEFYNSIYSYPENVTTVATEWTNHQGKKALCLVEFKIQHELYIEGSMLFEFNYVAEILIINESNYELFKNDYLYALENIKWDKNYINSQFNQAISAPQIRNYQMVVRKEPLISYLRSIDWKNSANYATWKAEQICLGRQVEEEYLQYNDEYDYDPYLEVETNKWEKISK